MDAKGNHVVMSLQTHRELLGVGSEEEFAESVASLRISLTQAAAGQTISLNEAAGRRWANRN
jgi:hypothetical protein